MHFHLPNHRRPLATGARGSNTHRNGELGGEVRRTVGGEDRLGTGQRLGLCRPNAGEGVTVRAAEPGLHVDVLAWEVQQVLDVIEEAAAVYLVHEVRSDHGPKIFLRNKHTKGNEGKSFERFFGDLVANASILRPTHEPCGVC